MRGLVSVLLAAPAAAGQCLSLPAADAACPALSSCTDTTSSGQRCRDSVHSLQYCAQLTAWQAGCAQCTCKPGCLSDPGSKTPADWRPSGTNPYAADGTSANGGVALSTAQKTAIVAQHNFVRTYHGACPVQWSNAIEANVRSSFGNSCELAHSPNSARANKVGFQHLGENLATASSSYFANNHPVELRTMAWYDEVVDWDFNAAQKRSGGGAVGHFTQVVWKSTTHIGCYMWQCDSQFGKTVLLACQYGPSGNYAGQHANEVGRPGTVAANCTNGCESLGVPPAGGSSPAGSIAAQLAVAGVAAAAALLA